MTPELTNVISTDRTSDLADDDPLLASQKGSLVIGVVLLGVVLRVIRYVSCSSIWHDEASVALNLMSRSFGDLMRPLDFAQGAPVGWLWLSKAACEVFGYNEWALRMPAFLTGLATPIVFYFVARRLLKGTGLIVAMLLVSLLEPLVHYSNELKPYSFDVLLALVILWFLAPGQERRGVLRSLPVLALVGSFCTWFSLASVFMLAGVGMVWIAHAWMNSGRSEAARRCVTAMCWVGSFAVHFAVSLSALSRSNELHDWWKGRGAYMPFPPTSFSDVRWFSDAAIDFFVDPMGLGFSGLGLLLVVAGVVLSVRRHKWELLALIMPVAFVLMASLLKQYPWGTSKQFQFPLMGRSTLWVVPLAAIMIGSGISMCLSLGGGRHRWFGWGAALLVLYPATLMAVARGLKPVVVQDIRPAILALNEKFQTGDVVCANDLSWRTLLYYSQRDHLAWEKNLHILVEWQPPIPVTAKGQNRVWLMLAYIDPKAAAVARERLLLHWRAEGVETASQEWGGTELLLFDLSQSAGLQTP